MSAVLEKLRMVHVNGESLRRLMAGEPLNDAEMRDLARSAALTHGDVRRAEENKLIERATGSITMDSSTLKTLLNMAEVLSAFHHEMLAVGDEGVITVTREILIARGSGEGR